MRKEKGPTRKDSPRYLPIEVESRDTPQRWCNDIWYTTHAYPDARIRIRTPKGTRVDRCTLTSPPWGVNFQPSGPGVLSAFQVRQRETDNLTSYTADNRSLPLFRLQLLFWKRIFREKERRNTFSKREYTTQRERHTEVNGRQKKRRGGVHRLFNIIFLKIFFSFALFLLLSPWYRVLDLTYSNFYCSFRVLFTFHVPNSLNRLGNTIFWIGGEGICEGSRGIAFVTFLYDFFLFFIKIRRRTCKKKCGYEYFTDTRRYKRGERGWFFFFTFFSSFVPRL